MDNTLEIICANCQTAFEETAQTIVDGEDIELKAAILQDELNALDCPHCQTSVQPLTPIYYYDLSKKLVLILLPEELALSEEEKQGTIAELTQNAIHNIAKKRRKRWLREPQIFTSYVAMTEAILTADGITPEILTLQQERARLIEEFMPLSHGTMFDAKVKEHEAELDTTFFGILATYMQAAQMQGDEERTKIFLDLRTRLSRSSPERKAIIAEIDAQLGLTIVQDQADLLEKLQATQSKAERKTLIAAGFDHLDDEFFQLLTDKFDRAARTNDSTVELFNQQLRDDILELKTIHENESRVALEKAEALFKEVIQADAPDQVLKQKVANIEETFFFVLGTNIAKARQQGQDGAAQALELIGRVAAGLLQERQAGLQTK